MYTFARLWSTFWYLVGWWDKMCELFLQFSSTSVVCVTPKKVHKMNPRKRRSHLWTHPHNFRLPLQKIKDTPLYTADRIIARKKAYSTFNSSGLCDSVTSWAPASLEIWMWRECCFKPGETKHVLWLLTPSRLSCCHSNRLYGVCAHWEWMTEFNRHWFLLIYTCPKKCWSSHLDWLVARTPWIHVTYLSSHHIDLMWLSRCEHLSVCRTFFF